MNSKKEDKLLPYHNKRWVIKDFSIRIGIFQCPHNKRHKHIQLLHPFIIWPPLSLFSLTFTEKQLHRCSQPIKPNDSTDGEVVWGSRKMTDLLCKVGFILVWHSGGGLLLLRLLNKGVLLGTWKADVNIVCLEAKERPESSTPQSFHSVQMRQNIHLL